MSYQQLGLNISEVQNMTTVNLQFAVEIAALGGNITSNNRWPTNRTGTGVFPFESVTSGDVTFYMTGFQLRTTLQCRVFSDNGDDVTGEPIRIEKIGFKFSGDPTYKEMVDFGNYKGAPPRYDDNTSLVSSWFTTRVPQDWLITSAQDNGGNIELVAGIGAAAGLSRLAVGDKVFISQEMAADLGCDSGIVDILSVDSTTNYSFTINEAYSTTLSKSYTVLNVLDVAISIAESSGGTGEQSIISHNIIKH